MTKNDTSLYDGKSHAPHGACELKYWVGEGERIKTSVTLPTERVS